MRSEQMCAGRGLRSWGIASDRKTQAARTEQDNYRQHLAVVMFSAMVSREQHNARGHLRVLDAHLIGTAVRCACETDLGETEHRLVATTGYASHAPDCWNHAYRADHISSMMTLRTQ